MSETINPTGGNTLPTDELRKQYNMPDTSESIIEAIHNNVDRGRGIHTGGAMEPEEFSIVTSGRGNGTRQELEAANSLAYQFAGTENPSIDSTDRSLSGLPLEEARDASIAALTQDQSYKGKDIHVSTDVIDTREGGGANGVFETRFFMPNGQSTPRVLESFSTYAETDPQHGARFGELQNFTVASREATPQETQNFLELQEYLRQEAA